MEIIYGAAILVVAISLLGFARFAVANWEGSRMVTRFAATEIVAMLITTLSAFGLAFLAAGVAGDNSGFGLAEVGAAFGVVLVVFIAVIRMTGRRSPSVRPVPATPAALHPATT